VRRALGQRVHRRTDGNKGSTKARIVSGSSHGVHFWSIELPDEEVAIALDEQIVEAMAEVAVNINRE
jgi:hypothetical protein